MPNPPQARHKKIDDRGFVGDSGELGSWVRLLTRTLLSAARRRNLCTDVQEMEGVVWRATRTGREIRGQQNQRVTCMVTRETIEQSSAAPASAAKTSASREQRRCHRKNRGPRRTCRRGGGLSGTGWGSLAIATRPHTSGRISTSTPPPMFRIAPRHPRRRARSLGPFSCRLDGGREGLRGGDHTPRQT